KTSSRSPRMRTTSWASGRVTISNPQVASQSGHVRYDVVVVASGAAVAAVAAVGTATILAGARNGGHHQFVATATMTQTTIHVRRSEARPHTVLPWLDSHHSFSFGRHWDPDNRHHGLLLVSNDDTVRAGSGFSTHPHQDMEIVTWVLDGELEH